MVRGEIMTVRCKRVLMGTFTLCVALYLAIELINEAQEMPVGSLVETL